MIKLIARIPSIRKAILRYAFETGMETGIYKEMKQMIEDEQTDVAYFKKHGDRRTEDYCEGRVEVLVVVLDKLERHGLRYDEHGESGQIDGKSGIRFVAELLKPPTADEIDSIPNSFRIKVMNMERSIALLEARVKTLSDLQRQHKPQ